MMNLPPLPELPHSRQSIAMSDAEIQAYAEQYGRLCAEAERALLDEAFAEEIERVSTIEYDSNAICRHFFGKLKERMDRARSK